MEDKKDDIEEIVRIEIVIPDPVHFSGGTFCSFINLLPIASEKPLEKSSVSIDFISLNLYGIVIYDNRLINTKKSDKTLHFPFLQSERLELQQHQELSLIFSSDPVVLCTSREFGANFEELYYRYRAILPPFLPPSFSGKYVSYSYFIFITVQYRNSLNSKVIKTISKKLEFNLLGSIYDDFPILDVKYFPILPKTGGFYLADLYQLSESECIKIITSQLNEKEIIDNLYFHFKSSVEDTLQEDISSEKITNSLVSRDLDLIWILWDSFRESGNQQGKPYELILESFDNLVKVYKNLDYKSEFDKIQNFRLWFCDLFPMEFYGDDTPENANQLLLEFLRSLEIKMTSYYGKTIEEMREYNLNKTNDNIRSKNEENINFSFDGNKLCMCSIYGFSTIDEFEELEISVESWFSIYFDFSEANRHCLKVQVSLTRLEDYCDSFKTASTHVIEESMITLGKTNGTITSFVSSLVVPSFNHFLSKVSYQLEITFFCFEEHVEIFDQASVKSGLNKLKMVRWTRPVKVLQNYSLRSHLEEFHDLEKPGDLKHSRTFAKNKLSSFMFSPKNLPLYKVIKI